jgi:RHS repeat-associated protein
LLHDEETGLVYNRARMLHPILGRFAQRDPEEYNDGMNFYQYLRSAPTLYRDAKGTACTVTFQCSLATSSPSGRCDTNCGYTCLETHRVDSAVGPVQCTDLKAKLVISDDLTKYGSALCRYCHIDRPRPTCPTTYSTKKVYINFEQVPTRDCSRAACRAGCDNVYLTASYACKLLGPGKKVCEALATAAKETCYDSCNSWCTKP